MKSRSSPGQVPPPPAISLIAHRNRKKLYRAETTTMDVDERFDVTAVIGRGSYGVVCRCDDAVTGGKVAIKKIERVFSDLIDGRRIWREVVVLRLLRDARARNVMHVSHLLQPTEELSSFQDLYLVCAHYTGDLASMTPKTLPVTAAARMPTLARPSASDGVRCVLADVLTAVADLHALGVIHRDIKPQNVLIDEWQVMHLCDYGLARGGVERVATLPAGFTDHVVTRWYRAPELLTMAPYHYPVDVFSVGCVAAEVLLKRPLFGGRDYMDQLRLVVLGLHPDERELDMSFITSEPARRFIQGCYKRGAAPMSAEERLKTAGASNSVTQLILTLCAFNPTTRPSASESLEHPAIRELVAPHPEPDLLRPDPDQDWSLDALPEVSEARLRRAIWNEIQRTQSRR